MNRWKRAIETWFTGKEEQMVRQIADLVAVPSVGGESAGPCQPFGEGPAKALEVALLQAQAAGLRAENQGGYVLTADLNDCPDELHILAHLDVVAPGEGWDTDPYTLVQEGDLIYGRGVDDDKGPAVAAMMAMECVKALNVPLKRNVKLVLGTDEESGSRDIAHYYATVPYAPCSFSPDAEFPVINIEKDSTRRSSPANGKPSLSCLRWFPSPAASASTWCPDRRKRSFTSSPAAPPLPWLWPPAGSPAPRSKWWTSKAA